MHVKEKSKYFQIYFTNCTNKTQNKLYIIVYLLQFTIVIFFKMSYNITIVEVRNDHIKT